MGLIKRMVHSIQSRTPIMLLFRFLFKPFINSKKAWRFIFRLPLVGRMKLKLPSGRTLILETDRTDDIYKLLFWRGFRGFEIETVEVFLTLVQNARTIIDIGASTGYYSLIAALENENSNIYSFEPLDTAFNSLKNNIEINHLKNIKPVNMALSNDSGKITLYIPNGDIPTSSSIVKGFRKAERELEVETRTLDDFAEKEKINGIDIIKIDIEEGEIFAFKGMPRILEKMRPFIISEVLGSEKKKDIQDLMESKGYVFYLITDKGVIKKENIQGDMEFRNYLYVPNEKSGDLASMLEYNH
jgi:FkbM family methyltransferase